MGGETGPRRRGQRFGRVRASHMAYEMVMVMVWDCTDSSFRASTALKSQCVRCHRHYRSRNLGARIVAPNRSEAGNAAMVRTRRAFLRWVGKGAAGRRIRHSVPFVHVVRGQFLGCAPRRRARTGRACPSHQCGPARSAPRTGRAQPWRIGGVSSGRRTRGFRRQSPGRNDRDSVSGHPGANRQPVLQDRPLAPAVPFGRVADLQIHEGRFCSMGRRTGSREHLWSRRYGLVVLSRDEPFDQQSPLATADRQDVQITPSAVSRLGTARSAGRGGAGNHSGQCRAGDGYISTAILHVPRFHDVDGFHRSGSVRKLARQESGPRRRADGHHYGHGPGELASNAGDNRPFVVGCRRVEGGEWKRACDLHRHCLGTRRWDAARCFQGRNRSASRGWLARALSSRESHCRDANRHLVGVSSEVGPPMRDTQPTVVITIIHGGAAWSEPDGRFSSTLKSILAQEGRIFSMNYFHWSGRSRVGQRRRAARDLASQLMNRLEDYPGAVHFLVGERRVSAVVCRGMLPVDHVRWKERAAAMASRALSVASLKTSWWKKLSFFALVTLLIGLQMLDFCEAGFKAFFGYEELFGFGITEILSGVSTLGVCFGIAHWLSNESDRFGLLREISGKDDLEFSLLVVRPESEDATVEIWADALAEIVARFVTRPPHGSVSS
jgi:hypothetical protein